MEWSDETAIDRAKTGDADAYRVLVERHSRTLFRLAFRMTGNEQDAEDIVQESLLRGWRQIDKYDARASFGTWLYRIAVNCSLDSMRAKKRRSEVTTVVGEGEAEDPLFGLATDDPGPDRVAMSSQVRQRISEAMDELSPSERTAFVLRHFEGMNIDDVSRVLGCQPGAAKHSIFRAVQKMRRVLEPLVSTAR
jgi:RNA polymerase sigma-70 factor (ECF subfamily)